MADAPGAPSDITNLLKRWQSGDAQALEDVTPLVYRELHQIASRYLSRERRDHTLQSTALVHEAFVKLVDQRRVDWQNRAHFFAIAAQLMRRVLVDYARRTGRVKRGGDVERVTLDDALVPGPSGRGLALEDILSIDHALEELHQLDPRQSQIVEMRYFGGLTVEEIAETIGLSEGTVKREWVAARAWLYRRLGGAGA